MVKSHSKRSLTILAIFTIASLLTGFPAPASGLTLSPNLTFNLTWPINKLFSSNGTNTYSTSGIKSTSALNASNVYLYSTATLTNQSFALGNVARLVTQVYDFPVDGNSSILLVIRETVSSTATTASHPDTATVFKLDPLLVLKILQLMPVPIHGIVFDLEIDGNECQRVSDELQVKHDWVASFVSGVKNGFLSWKTGVGYNSRNIGCPTLVPVIQISGLLLLTIDFPIDEGFHHSQSLFAEHVGNNTSANNAFTQSAHNKQLAQVIYHMKLSGKADVGQQRHVNLFKKLYKAWVVQNNNLMVILDAQSVGTKFSSSPNNPSENKIVPIVLKGRTMWDSRLKQMVDYYYLPAKMCQVASAFQTVVVHADVWTQLVRFPKITCGKQENTTGTKLNVLLYYDTLPSKFDDNLFLPIRGAGASQWSATGVVLPSSQLADVSKLLASLPKNKNVTIECRVCLGWDFASARTPQDLIALTNATCSAVQPQVSLVIWETDIDLGNWESAQYPSTFYRETLRRKLSIVYEAIFQLLKKLPKKKVVLMIKLHRSSLPLSSSLLCDQPTRKINELYEALANWAYLNNGNLIFKSGFNEKPATVGLWSALEPDRALEETARKFPQFEMRNYHPSPQAGVHHWWKPSPCVKLPEKTTPPSGAGSVVFDEGLTGATLNMTIRETPLLTGELQTLLHFSFIKFSIVEVIAKDENDVSTLVSALSQVFLRNIKELGRAQKLLFVDVPFEAGQLQNLEKLEINATTSVKLGGVQYASKIIDKSTSVLPTVPKVPIGVVLDDCPRFVKQLLTESSLYNLNGVSYLVCSVPSKTASLIWDGGNLGKYLDGHLYMSSILKKYYPNKHVYFRVTSRTACDETPEGNTRDFLLFTNTLVQFAKSYGLGYFLVKALPFTQAEKENTWWQIKDYKDLTRRELYTEKEADLQNKSTLIPAVDYGTTNTSPSAKTYIIAGLSLAVVGISIISILQALHAKCFPKQVRLLSPEEVENFYNNGYEPPREIDTTEECAIQLSLLPVMSYDSKREISKPELHLHSATPIGMGTFGLVTRTVLNGTEVAVKIPNDQCSKQSFMSMLSEVKILCYVGSHPNVVEFIGCHTKEIGSGMVYIVTGLCENGNLQDYLRRTVQESRVSFDEMTRFSYEIASGMKYIADKMVVHADLSARNVLLATYNTCKIGDFGLSRRLYESSMYVKKNLEPLPWRWMAYESLKRMEFTSMSDVWSYGITLWEIFTMGDVPYPGLQWTLDFVEELERGLRLKIPTSATEKIYDLMVECWNEEPTRRPTFPELQHFFLELRNRNYHNLNESCNL